MQKIKGEKDLLILPTSYMQGLERMLEEIVSVVDTHSLEAMNKIVNLQRWLQPHIADNEIRKSFPDIQWDNVHLLLPPKENCSCQCNCEKDNELSQQ